MIFNRSILLSLALVISFYGCNNVSETEKNHEDPISQNKGYDKYDNYTDWAIYRGDKKANQYSELAQINAANVHALEPVWEYHTGDPNGPSMYSNPIVVNGLMYFTTPKLNVVALNA